MPTLSEISYSQDLTVHAFRDYYKFLSCMYLNESDVVEPPLTGWPTITEESMQSLEKSSAVVSLLRHLPYIKQCDSEYFPPHGAAWCTFIDYRYLLKDGPLNLDDGSELKATSELDFQDQIPSHVISLTRGETGNPMFLLDTQLGIIYWPECLTEIEQNATNLVEDDPLEWAPEIEIDWRADSAAWAIADFFQMLKTEFLELNFIPTTPRIVFDVYSVYPSEDGGRNEALQQIYRKHGWPNLEIFSKRDCLQSVWNAMENWEMRKVAP